MTDEEIWVEALSTSMAGMEVPQVIEDGMKCLTAIVEPFTDDFYQNNTEACEAYYDFMDKYPGSWLTLITHLNSEFERAAQYILDNGY